MTQPHWEDEAALPLLAIGAALVRGWRKIAWSAVAGAAVAAVWGLLTVPTYTATASFTAEGTDAARNSTLANLAGQFGVQVPASGQSVSPEFYVRLLRSPAVLLAIARDTFSVDERGGARSTIADLLEIRGETPARREEKTLKRLAELVRPSSEKLTGVVTVSITTEWASVSHAVVESLVRAVNDYNLKTRQGQATAERKFLEARVAAAAADLRGAENDLEALLTSNRQISGSPELQIQRDRFQRSVTMKQTIYASLAQAFEQARLREVRDTPVISIVEPPSYPQLPNSRGRVVAVAAGVVIGALVGMLIVYATVGAARRRAIGDPDFASFTAAVREARDEIGGRVLRLWRR